jgi:hypothetical protein
MGLTQEGSSVSTSLHIHNVRMNEPPVPDTVITAGFGRTSASSYATSDVD